MSPFANILQHLVEKVPGATSAVFAAWDGESVDFFGDLPPLDIQLIGAHWGLVLSQTEERCGAARIGHVQGALVESERATTLLERVTDQYYVVLQLKPASPLGSALVELKRSVLAIRGEM